MQYGNIKAIGHVDLRYLKQSGKIVIETGLAAPNSLIAVGPAAAALLRPVASAATRVIAIGGDALPLAIAAAQDNIAIGYGAGAAVTTGTGHVLIGTDAGAALTAVGSGYDNVFIGRRAGATGANSESVYVGVQAGELAGVGFNGDVLIGARAGSNALTYNSVCVGWEAALSGAQYSVVIGERATAYHSNRIIGGVVIGYNAGGGGAGDTPDVAVLVGYRAAFNIEHSNQVVAVGAEALEDLVSGGDGNTAVGYRAAQHTTSPRNTVIGNFAGNQLIASPDNIIIGSREIASANPSGPTNSLGFNIIIGSYNSAAGVTLAETPAAGTQYLVVAANQTIAVVDPLLTSVHLGSSKPGNWRTTSGTDNVSIGAAAADATTTGSRNMAVGSNALGRVTTGADNVAVGNSALLGAAGSEAALRNIAIGSFALDAVTAAAADNVVLGYNAATGATNLQTSVVLGASAFDAATSSTTARAVIIGYNAAGNAATAAPVDAVIIGYQSALATTTAAGGVVIGSGAGAAVTTGPYNTLIGFGVAPNLTTGRNNVVIGAYEDTATFARTSAADSTGQIVVAAEGDAEAGLSQSLVVVALQSVYVGSAKPGNWLTSTGTSNVGVGDGALGTLSSGTLNAAIGAFAGGGVTTGTHNTLLGNNAGSSLTTGLRNILIGSGVGMPAVGTDDFLNIGKTIFGDLSTKNVRIGDVETVATAAQTERLAITTTNADTVAPFSIATTGANGAKIYSFSGTRDPNGLVTGDPGDIYYRKSGADSTPYVNVGAAAANTTWALLRPNATDALRTLLSPFIAVTADGLTTDGRTYAIYVGYITEPKVFDWVEFAVAVVGVGAQTAEVALASSPLAPVRATPQTLTKLAANGTLDDLTVGTGIKRNTVAMAATVNPGTHLWLLIRVSMATTQPSITFYSGSSGIMGSGYSAYADGVGALTAMTSAAFSTSTGNSSSARVLAGVCP